MRSADSRYSVKARRSERPDVARSGGYGGDNGKARANQEPAARSRGPSVSPHHVIEGGVPPAVSYIEKQYRLAILFAMRKP
jgi:hypothetical protein